MVKNHWKMCRKGMLRSYLFILFNGLQTLTCSSNSLPIPSINPSTPKSDQCQISPAASPEILHHTVWRTWLFTSYSDKRWQTTNSQHLTYRVLLKGWENAQYFLNLGERVKCCWVSHKPSCIKRPHIKWGGVEWALRGTVQLNLWPHL